MNNLDEAKNGEEKRITMKLKSVLGLLKREYDVEILESNIAADEEISEICLFEGRVKNQEKELYIGTADEITIWMADKDNKTERGFGLSAIIGVREKHEEDEYLRGLLESSLKNGTIASYALIREEHTLKALQAMNTIIQKELQASYRVAELMALTMRGADLKSLLVASEKTLQNPVIIIDAGFKILEISSKESIDDDIWLANIKRGYCSYEFIKVVHELDQKGPFPNNSDVFEVNCKASTYTKICSKIFHENQLVGYVIMIKKREMANTLFEEFIPMVGTSVCEVLLRTKEYQGIFGSQEENLLHELIHGADEELIHIRLKIHQMELPKNMGCLMVKTNEYLNNMQATAFLRQQIQHILPGGYCLEERGNLVFICKLTDDGRLTKDQENRLLSLFRQGVIHMGMSSPCHDVMELKDAYWQSAQLDQIASRLQVEKEVMYFSDYSFYIMLSSLEEKDLLQYSHPALNKLRKYDQDTNGELYKTLQVFIEHQSQMIKTAEALSIHRNSLSYRINKIIDLTGLDLTNNEEIFKLSYGFKVEKYCRVAV